MRRRTFLKLPALALVCGAPSLWFVGDSITVGSGASRADRAWADVVAQAHGLPWHNLGISGSPIAEQAVAAGDVPSGALVYWLAGYNDVRNTPNLVGAADELRRALILLKARGCSVSVGNSIKQVAGGFEAREQEMGRLIKEACQLTGARLVDTLSLTVPMGPDQTHPNDAGHAVIAQAMLAGRISLPLVTR